MKLSYPSSLAGQHIFGCRLWSILGLLALQAHRVACNGDTVFASDQHWLDSSPWPSESSQQCIGEDVSSRACQFSNLVYDTQEDVFKFFTTADEAAKLASTSAGQSDAIPYLQLGVSSWRLQAPNERFNLKFIGGEAFPSTVDSCDEAEPTYLHNPFRIFMYGHMIRDNFHIMRLNLRSLNIESIQYRLLLWTKSQPNPTRRQLRVPSKYVEYVATGLDLWSDVVAKCGRRYILFRNLVAGWGGVDLRPHELAADVCSRSNITAQRDAAYTLSNFEPAVPSTPNFKVVIADKPPTDKRRIANVGALVAALQTRFPQCTIESKVFEQMSAHEQLEVLSTTSVFISPVGSGSFRLLYLPDHAHVILIGAPESKTPGMHTRMAWEQVDKCWNNMEYVTIHRYRLTNDSEIQIRHSRDAWKEKNPAFYREMLLWDADSRPNPEVIGDMVEEASRALISV